MVGHYVSTMTFIWLSHILLLLFMVDYSYAQGRYIPDIQNVTVIDNRHLSENLPLSFDLGRVIATDRDGTKITYSLQGNGAEYFSIDKDTGAVKLIKLLNYEFQKEIRITVYVVDQNGQFNSRDCKVFVDDYNNIFPVFTEPAIFRRVPENAPIGYVLTEIKVTDKDTVNAQLQVTCGGDTTLFIETCETFALVVVESSNLYWRGNLTLSRTLDYEFRFSYNIRLIAYDGDPKHNTTNEVLVEVQDVNDTPPKFEYAPPKNILEEEAIGTSITTVTATDGDATNRRDIYYELYGLNIDLFQIDNMTGIISNAARLDYDLSDRDKGKAYDISVRAREIINNTGQILLGNDSTNTATLELKITVLDINDNQPEFSQTQYVASVYENTVSGANIPGLQMTVTDIDSGNYNSFDLSLENYTNVFGIIPPKDAASASATIFIRDATKIDYETGIRQYIITVLAKQNFPNPNMYTGTTTVTINVLDVNDETPSFSNSYYTASVSETAVADTFVINIQAQDREEGDFGLRGIYYRLFGDSTPPHFQINETTGRVTVAPCNQPGMRPCIDYERKQNYTLTVSATDNRNQPGSRTRSVQLYIQVIDENDNIPRIDSSYTRYINEGEMLTINPLIIEVIDPDTVGRPITMIITGDSTNLWQIITTPDNTGNVNGNITAVRPIKYTDAPIPGGEFSFAVVVQDQKNPPVTSNIKIIVIDINDNTPKFKDSMYNMSIPETTRGDVYVIRVTASDGDAPTTGNGVIDFSIQSGAQGKFTVTNVTMVGREFVADIYTTKDAIFNFETQEIYFMVLLARDQGSPRSRSATAILRVTITDANNKNPRFQPSFQSIRVYENEPVGKSVYRVTATDLDKSSKLTYYMTADQATDRTGDNVNQSVYDYTTLFRIDETTGDILVSAPLERDNASRIIYNLLVKDINASTIQTGNGTLLIHILEYNDKAPWFDLPIYNISMKEEMNIKSFVQNLYCRDVDNKISEYTIKQDNPGSPIFFSLLAGSGAMTVNQRIDYEQIQRIELTATCKDSGQPQLSNTTRIIVNVLNINDNTPNFTQIVYQTSILENTVGGILNVTVKATDLDKGDYGVVMYQLEDTSGYFTIDNITGVITTLPNAVFDREKQDFLSFLVVAYDSPMDPSVRRNSSAHVIVAIEDVNDNCPVFNKPTYMNKVPEGIATGTDVIDIIVSDADADINQKFVLAIKPGSGTPQEADSLFGINSYGRVYTKASLKGRIMSYNFNVTATNIEAMYPGIVCNSSEVPVQIEVQRSDNNAPQWIRPSYQNFVIYVLESQYDGLVVYDADAVDNDVGDNGKIDYYFSVNDDQLVSETAEFKINRITGVISTKIEFDREQIDTYILNLMAKDRGIPAATSQITLVVSIQDVNDNKPKFEMKDGVVKPLELPAVPENITIPSGGYLLGSCKAFDADKDVENNHIYYVLIAPRLEVSKCISVNNITCELRLLMPVDFETTPVLTFNIYAYNEKNDDSVIRTKRQVDPSILPVYLPITNSNDNPPVFSKNSYTACVSVDAPYNQNILYVSATDMDKVDTKSLNYSLDGTMAFKIDPKRGAITNIISFHESSNGQQIYWFKALAAVESSTATATVAIIVTSASNTVSLKVNQPLNDVLPFKQQFTKTLEDSSNGAINFACVDSIKSYVDDSGKESSATTSVVVAAFRKENGQYIPYSDLKKFINTEKQQSNSVFEALHVSDVQTTGNTNDSIFKEDAVLAVFIICILLILLTIILLCVACLCIRNSHKKNKKSIKAASHTIIPVQEPLETSFNPVYNVGPVAVDETVYSTVKKVHSNPSMIISPVIIPAPLETGGNNEAIPTEPLRHYISDRDEPEPYIEAYIDPEPDIEPEPVFETYIEPEPEIEAYIDPEPYIEPEHAFQTYIEPEPVIETYIDQEPVVERVPTQELVQESPRKFEPVDETKSDGDYYEPDEAYHHAPFPDTIEGDEMDTSIRDSPPPTPPSVIRYTPHPSPQSSVTHERPPGKDSN